MAELASPMKNKNKEDIADAENKNTRKRRKSNKRVSFSRSIYIRNFDEFEELQGVAAETENESKPPGGFGKLLTARILNVPESNSGDGIELTCCSRPYDYDEVEIDPASLPWANMGKEKRRKDGNVDLCEEKSREEVPECQDMELTLDSEMHWKQPADKEELFGSEKKRKSVGFAQSLFTAWDVRRESLGLKDMSLSLIDHKDNSELKEMSLTMQRPGRRESNLEVKDMSVTLHGLKGKDYSNLEIRDMSLASVGNDMMAGGAKDEENREDPCLDGVISKEGEGVCSTQDQQKAGECVDKNGGEDQLMETDDCEEKEGRSHLADNGAQNQEQCKAVEFQEHLEVKEACVDEGDSQLIDTSTQHKQETSNSKEHVEGDEEEANRFVNLSTQGQDQQKRNNCCEFIEVDEEEEGNQLADTGTQDQQERNDCKERVGGEGEGNQLADTAKQNQEEMDMKMDDGENGSHLVDPYNQDQDQQEAKNMDEGKEGNQLADTVKLNQEEMDMKMDEGEEGSHLVDPYHQDQDQQEAVEMGEGKGGNGLVSPAVGSQDDQQEMNGSLVEKRDSQLVNAGTQDDQEMNDCQEPFGVDEEDEQVAPEKEKEDSLLGCDDEKGQKNETSLLKREPVVQEEVLSLNVHLSNTTDIPPEMSLLKRESVVQEEVPSVSVHLSNTTDIPPDVIIPGLTLEGSKIADITIPNMTLEISKEETEQKQSATATVCNQPSPSTQEQLLPQPRDTPVPAVDDDDDVGFAKPSDEDLSPSKIRKILLDSPEESDTKEFYTSSLNQSAERVLPNSSSSSSSLSVPLASSTPLVKRLPFLTPTPQKKRPVEYDLVGSIKSMLGAFDDGLSWRFDTLSSGSVLFKYCKKLGYRFVERIGVTVSMDFDSVRVDGSLLLTKIDIKLLNKHHDDVVEFGYALVLDYFSKAALNKKYSNTRHLQPLLKDVAKKIDQVHRLARTLFRFSSSKCTVMNSHELCVMWMGGDPVNVVNATFNASCKDGGLCVTLIGTQVLFGNATKTESEARGKEIVRTVMSSV